MIRFTYLSQAALHPRNRPSCFIRKYHERIIDHYENPRNVGALDKSKQNVGTGLGSIIFSIYFHEFYFFMICSICFYQWELQHVAML